MTHTVALPQNLPTWRPRLAERLHRAAYTLLKWAPLFAVLPSVAIPATAPEHRALLWGLLGVTGLAILLCAAFLALSRRTKAQLRRDGHEDAIWAAFRPVLGHLLVADGLMDSDGEARLDLRRELLTCTQDGFTFPHLLTDEPAIRACVHGAFLLAVHATLSSPWQRWVAYTLLSSAPSTTHEIAAPSAHGRLAAMALIHRVLPSL